MLSTKVLCTNKYPINNGSIISNAAVLAISPRKSGSSLTASSGIDLKYSFPWLIQPEIIVNSLSVPPASLVDKTGKLLSAYWKRLAK